MTLDRFRSDDRPILALVVLASIAVHGVAMIEGLGEQDSARILNDAFIWKDNPGYLSSPEVEYRPRVLPLVLVLVRLLLQLGIPLSSMPQIMNGTNVGVGALALVPLFLIWRRIAGRQAAYIALALASAMPAFWLANIYGYPHLIGFALFLAALNCFLIALDHDGRAFVRWSILAGALLALSLGTKADLILSGGAFLGAAWLTRRLTVTTTVAALAIPTAALVFASGMYEIIAGSEVTPVAYAAEWEQRFPLSLASLLGSENRAVTLRAPGRVMAMAVALSAVILLFRPDDRRTVFFIMAWTIPTLLFWGVRQGNSARHLMAAFVPMAVLASIAIRRIGGTRLVGALATIVLLVANYGVGSPNRSSIAPSARLIASRALFQDYVAGLHAAAGAIADFDEKSIFVLGKGGNAYATFALLTKARSVRRVQPEMLELQREDGAIQRVGQAYVVDHRYAAQAARQRQEEGYHVVSIDYDLAALLKDFPAPETRPALSVSQTPRARSAPVD